MDDDQNDLFPLAASLLPIASPSKVRKRLINSAVAIATEDQGSLLFQHTVFLPSRTAVS